MSYLVKAATQVACTIIQAEASKGATSFDTNAISRQSVSLVMSIRSELMNHHDGVCDPDMITPQKVDEIIGKHVNTIHGMLHRNA